MARSRRGAIATFLTLASSLVPLPAFADAASDAAKQKADPADPLVHARELFVEGSAKAEAGDWEAARDRFARSAKLKHAPLTLYNLGIAQEETGHLLDALASFRAFLAAPLEPATKQYADPVRADVAKLEHRIPRIEVSVQPMDAANVTITVDGKPAESPVAVDPGFHEVAVNASGFGEARQKMAVGEGGRSYLSVSLAPRRVEPAVTPAMGVGLTAGGAALVALGGIVVGLGAADRPKSGADREIAVGSVVGGVGAIAFGTGIGLIVARVVRARDPSPPLTAFVPVLGPRSVGVKLSF